MRLSPKAGDGGRKASQRPEDLPREFAVKPTKLQRLRNKILISLPGKFALEDDRLLERAYPDHPLDKASVGLERLPRVIAIDFRNRLDSGREHAGGPIATDRRMRRNDFAAQG